MQTHGSIQYRYAASGDRVGVEFVDGGCEIHIQWRDRGVVREREFWELLEEIFGRSYGRSLARDQQLTVLENMSVVQALEAGVEPRTVWNVLCDQMDVPDSKRWGKDHNAPPLPAR